MKEIARQSKEIHQKMKFVEKRLYNYRTILTLVQEGLNSDLFNQNLIIEERQQLHNIEYLEIVQERILK